MLFIVLILCSYLLGGKVPYYCASIIDQETFQANVDDLLSQADEEELFDVDQLQSIASLSSRRSNKKKKNNKKGNKDKKGYDTVSQASLTRPHTGVILRINSPQAKKRMKEKKAIEKPEIPPPPLEPPPFVQEVVDEITVKPKQWQMSEPKRGTIARDIVDTVRTDQEEFKISRRKKKPFLNSTLITTI